jgi:hypothetical protein
VTDPACGDEGDGEGLQIVFQADRLVVHVWLFNHQDPEMVPEDAYPVDADTLLELGTIAEEKAYAALDAEPGDALEPIALRLGDGETIYASAFDDFGRIDGETLPIDGESDESREMRIASYGDAADVYQIAQPFENQDGEQVVYTNTIYRFEDEDTASDWMSAAEDRLPENDRYENVEELDLDDSYGDESIGFTLTDVQLETELARVYARFGSIVVVLSAGTADADLPEAAESLMTAQVECIENGYCVSAEPFPVR